MKITHHGHSCIELDIEGTRLLFDPGTFSTFDEVRDVDAIVVTHHHPDHLDVGRLPNLCTNNERARWYADPQTASQLAGRGIPAEVTSAGAEYVLNELTLTGIGSTHAEIHPYIERIDNVGVLVTAPGHPSVFHPGDSLEGRPENVDYLCVPLSAPWSAVKDTIAFVRAVAPRHIIPIHDKVCAEQARGIYLGHIRDYGMDGGVDVVDIAEGDVRNLT